MNETNSSSTETQLDARMLGIKIQWAKTPAKTTTPVQYFGTFEGRAIVPAIRPSVGPTVNGSLTNETKPRICAPFPPCNPIGCENPEIAPIDCEECNSTATAGAIFGMTLLSLFIIVANFLVIRVILQTPSLRRRHGYIKLSLAMSDLLVGLFVIPSAIGNLVSSLYYPHQITHEDDIIQPNSTTSVIFGTIAVVSVISSLYNLLLLSIDRLIAIARPLKHRAGRYLPKKSLWVSMSLVWIFGISLAVIPAFFPAYFSYEMDVTTFFYIQRVVEKEGSGSGFPPYYVIAIIGGPYFATVVLNIATAVHTWKSLQVRKRLSTRRNLSKSAIEKKRERNRRLKMLQDAYPEVSISERSSRGNGIFKKGTPRHDMSSEERQRWLFWWRSDDSGRKPNCYNANYNNSTEESEESQGNSQSPRYQRTRDQIQIVRDILNPPNARTQKKQLYAKHKTHIRVFRMLIAMVVAFSVCLLPYMIVMLKISDESIHCSNAALPYAFAVYMVFLNSGMNFVIYNFWHPEFRHNLIKTFKRDYSRTTTIRRVAGSLFSTSHNTDTCTTYAPRPGAEKPG